MIEVLIAILVVALGVLSISRLQTNMIRANQSALLRSEASFQVYNMLDRLRSDRQAALNGVYDRDFADPRPSATACDALPDYVGLTLPVNETMEWLCAVETLPLGQGAITTNGNTITVSVQWDDSRGQEAAEVFTTVSEL
jgi:type IV pilus assembly protein PilV